MEQCSSEQTARYKASVASRLLEDLHPKQPTLLADLTGGFGVDIAFMSEAFDEALYVEQNSELFPISSANLALLAKNVECRHADGIEVLHQLDHCTMVFMDPARRDEHGGRTYGIADCTPNVLAVKDELLAKADFVMLKLSPMLDWRKAVEDIGQEYVREVHIVSVDNECKELLVVASSNSGTSPNPLRREGAIECKVFCVNNDQVWEVPSTTQKAPSLRRGLGEVASFLYEPNASVMKAGCFDAVASVFGVSQVAPNSHLFTADRLCEDFPGRRFSVTAVSSMNKRELKTALHGLQRANITVRNFPLSAEQLRQRLKLKDGGDAYLFATTDANGQHLLFLCHRISS